MYRYKEDLALNNLQWLICRKTQPNQILYIFIYMYKEDLALTYHGWYAIKSHQTKLYIFNMYKEDLTLNNLQWLICHKTQPNQILYI